MALRKKPVKKVSMQDHAKGIEVSSVGIKNSLEQVSASLSSRETVINIGVELGRQFNRTLESWSAIHEDNFHHKTRGVLAQIANSLEGINISLSTIANMARDSDNLKKVTIEFKEEKES